MANRIAAISFAALCPLLVPAQPVITAVVNGASFEPVNSQGPFQAGVPRGALVSIFGSKLAQTTARAGGLPLPTNLVGTVVTVGALQLEAPLYFVSPGQINVQIPFEALGSTLPVVVSTPEGKSNPMVLGVVASAPGIFTQSGDGKGKAIALGQNFELLDVAEPGKPIILYATGLGATDPPVLSGSPGTNAEPLNRVVKLPEVIVGEFPARVDFAGLAPGFVGVYQINVVPERMGSDRIFIRSQGRLSNAASIGIAQTARNVTNATGTIEAIYPAGTNSFAAYSIIPLVVKFTASMDILPTAGPFLIAAVSDAGASIISVDPASGAFDATVTEPTRAARFGDFSQAEFQVIDLLTCSQGAAGVTCLPVPGNVIPFSRIPRAEALALDPLPLPNTDIAQSATGLFKVRGSVRAGSTFAIDGQNNSSVSAFAGYLRIPIPQTVPVSPGSVKTTTIKLFIDGQLVASADVQVRLSFSGRDGQL